MAVRRLIPVLGDQLSHDLTPLRDGDPAQDHILMMEVGQGPSVPHHPQKIALVFSAMRHFAEELRTQGWQVRYIFYTHQIAIFSQINGGDCRSLPQEIHVTRASEWRGLWAFAEAWPGPIVIHEDTIHGFLPV